MCHKWVWNFHPFSNNNALTNMSIKAIYWNARSVLNKLNDLQAAITVERPELVLITETWLHQGILSTEIEFSGYTLMSRKDRVDTIRGRGGGVAILCRNNIKSREILVNQRQTCGITVGTKHVFCAYLSPNATDEERVEMNLFLATREPN